MDTIHRESGEAMRALLKSGQAVGPDTFRAALTSVPASERDAWADVVLGLDGIPDDGPDLPRGCAPYVPCSVDALLRMIDGVDVQSSDVVVDLGSGIGRAATLVHLLTGARVIGIEVQRALVEASKTLAASLNVSRVPVVRGDAARLAGSMTIATVFFLYCPFTGERLERIVTDLEPIARARPIRICCVDLTLPSRPWLTPVPAPWTDLAIYRSTAHP